MSEKQKMLSGEMYDPNDAELRELRNAARRKTAKFNNTTPDHDRERATIIQSLFGTTGRNIFIEPAFRCDYGANIHVGDNFLRQL
ncbi:MAG: maltose acetyltransferase domain-containing protein [Balneolaceae bacterium]|nr:maltose acetyltransferase domain-containing protein [Balneolaceae bacterium]